MAFTVRQLLPGDEGVFADVIAVEHRFEHELDAEASLIPASDVLHRFLADPTVLFWVAAADDGVPVGSLHCYVQRRCEVGPWAELLLYDMGVDRDWRRRGVGRSLIDAMYEWMAEHGVSVVWVPAAPTAVDFYTACGFEPDEGTVMVSER